MSRLSHFEEGHGDRTVGFALEDSVICHDCANNNPEYATVDPRTAFKLRISHLENDYPDGFTCDGCGIVVALPRWDVN